MEDRLEEAQLVQLMEKLKTSHTWVKIVGEIEATLEHRISDYEFVVDRWPDCRAMVVRAKPNDIKLKYLEPIVNLYATDNDALRGLLHNLDWSKGKRFECEANNNIAWLTDDQFYNPDLHGGVASRLVPVLTEAIQLHRVPTLTFSDAVYLKVTRDTLKLRSIPEGCTLSSLGTDQAALVNSVWDLRNGNVSEAYVKHLITTLPSTCLHNQEGKLLGYALTYHYGWSGGVARAGGAPGEGVREGRHVSSRTSTSTEKERGVCHDTTCKHAVY